MNLDEGVVFMSYAAEHIATRVTDLSFVVGHEEGYQVVLGVKTTAVTLCRPACR